MSGMHDPEKDWEECFYCARERVKQLQEKLKDAVKRVYRLNDEVLSLRAAEDCKSLLEEETDPEVSPKEQDDMRVLVRDLAEKIKQHEEILQMGIAIRNRIESHVNTLTASVTLLEKKVDNEHRQFASDHRELVERVQKIDMYVGALGSRVGKLEVNSTTTMEIIENARRENKI